MNPDALITSIKLIILIILVVLIFRYAAKPRA